MKYGARHNWINSGSSSNDPKSLRQLLRMLTMLLTAVGRMTYEVRWGRWRNVDHPRLIELRNGNGDGLYRSADVW